MNIFIDTQDMEERYGEQLYQDYLVEQNKELHQENIKLKERINKAIEYMNKYNKVNAEKAKTEIDRYAMLVNANDLLEILKEQ